MADLRKRKALLTKALNAINLEIKEERDNKIFVYPEYEIEIEANGLYKLYDDGYVIAPFDSLAALCKFLREQ